MDNWSSEQQFRKRERITFAVLNFWNRTPTVETQPSIITLYYGSLIASAYTKREIIFTCAYCFYPHNFPRHMNMASIFRFPDSHFTGLSHDTRYLAKRQLHGDDHSCDELDLIAGTLLFTSFSLHETAVNY